MKALRGFVQTYAWGKQGSSSAVAQLAQLGDPTFQVDEQQTYAELWMGSHPSGPACLAEQPSVSLQQWLRENPAVLGKRLQPSSGSADLPFLLKVLSVARPLSIQVHPDLPLAAELHARAPEQYKDANHKPEMAIALTEFEACVGFAPAHTIAQRLRDVPELVELAGLEASRAFQTVPSPETLRELFQAVVLAPQEQLRQQVAALLSRLTSQTSASLSDVDRLVVRAAGEFPNDVGLFVVYFMNYYRLQPGQAVYLGARLLHAYVSGDCVEAMARSDNVVRAGFTPKFKDSETLISMLRYDMGRVPLVAEAMQDQCVSCYAPPRSVLDFQVLHARLEPGTSHSMQRGWSPRVMLVTHGAGQLSCAGVEPCEVSRGSVVFLEASAEITMSAAADQPLQIYACEAGAGYRAKRSSSRCQVL